MKVYIGPYKNYIGPYQIADAIFFWVDRRKFYHEDPPIYNRWDYKLHDKFGDWLAETWVMDFCNWLDKKRQRKINIKLHDYDTWSMDDTLSHIIVPMLEQLQKTKHGAPYVDDEDVPEYLRSTAAPPKENEWDTDNNHFKRWDWVVDEMIFAFTAKTFDWEDQFYSGKVDFRWEKQDNGLLKMVDGAGNTFKIDDEGKTAYHNRMKNGFRLFGKYYEHLWD